MTNKILLFVALILTAIIFNSSARAQTVGEGTIAVGGSKLTAINLPGDARRIKDGLFFLRA
jgi:hypothetical protein